MRSAPATGMRGSWGLGDAATPGTAREHVLRIAGLLRGLQRTQPSLPRGAGLGTRGQSAAP